MDLITTVKAGLAGGQSEALTLLSVMSTNVGENKTLNNSHTYYLEHAQ